MKFLHNDLGHVHSGSTIVVSLNRAANVKLMDNSNFSRYKRGDRHEYYGGQAVRSPIHLSVPHDGYWHVTVDLGGYAGSVRAGVQVLNA